MTVARHQDFETAIEEAYRDVYDGDVTVSVKTEDERVGVFGVELELQGPGGSSRTEYGKVRIQQDGDEWVARPT